MTVANPSNYWISGNALRITLNANGDADYIQGNTASGAMILCYIKGIDGLGYDAGHNYQRWKLLLSPTYFPTKSAKYVYVAIPRASAKVPQDYAQVCFPSQKLDIYGKNASEQQIGSTDYYYIWLQGIISASEVGGVLQDRVWTQKVQTGTLASDEAYEAGGDGTWWRYSSVDDTVTFLKKIAHAVFERLRITTRLIFGNSDESESYVSGVADSNTAETSTHDIVTPAYGKQKYLSREHDDTARGWITILQGIRTLEEFFEGEESGGGLFTDSEERAQLVADVARIRDKVLGSLNIENALNVHNSSAQGNVFADGTAISDYKAKVNGNARIDQVLVALAGIYVNLLKSDNFNGDGPFDSGFLLEKSKGGSKHSYLVVDELFVRIKAIFTELEIRKISYAGGNFIFSHAGSRIISVKEITKTIAASVVGAVLTVSGPVDVSGHTLNIEGTTISGNVITLTENPVTYSYRCYLMKDDGTTATENWWRVNDQARCQTFNVTEPGTYHNIENTYYWRRVVNVGYEKVTLTEGQTEQNYDYVDLSVVDCDMSSDIPKEGDQIVQMGNRTDPDRQGFVSLEVYGTYAPALKVYKNINSYSLDDGKRKICLSPKLVDIHAQRFVIETEYDAQPIPMERGAWDDIPGHACYYYDLVQHNGSSWLCIFPESGGFDEDGEYRMYTISEPREGATYWQIYAKAGKDGQDGKSFNILGSYDTVEELIAAHPTGAVSDAYIVAGYLYVWDEENTEWHNAGKIQGDDGRGIASVHISYAEDTTDTIPSVDSDKWQSSMSALTRQKGYYLFTRTRYEYTDNEYSEYFYTISYIGVDGTSPIVADLDNEVISIPCDKDGNVVGNFNKTVVAKIYNGSQPVTLSYLSCSSVPAGIGITTDKDNGTIAIAVTNGTSLALANNITVVMRASIGGNTVERKLSLAINGVRPGADGTPATVYDLLPSVSQIIKKKSGTKTPSTITCSVQKITGETISTNPSGVTLKYKIDGGTEQTYSGGISTSNISTSLQFILYKGSTSTVLDRETLFVVEDGVDGKSESVPILYLDDYDVQIEVDENGVALNSFTQTITPTVYNASGLSLDIKSLSVQTQTHVKKNMCYMTTIGSGKASVSGKVITLTGVASVSGTVLTLSNDDYAILPIITVVVSKGTTVTESQVSITGVAVDNEGRNYNVRNAFHITRVYNGSALQMVLSPETIILQQSMTGNQEIDCSQAYTDIVIRIGGTDYTSGITLTATPSSVEIGGVQRNTCNVSVTGNRVKITDILTYTEGSGASAKSVYFDQGYVTITGVFQGKTYTQRFNFLCNLLGTWKEIVENDTKTAIAQSTLYDFTGDTQVSRTETLGEFIASSKKYETKLTQKVIDANGNVIESEGSVYKQTYDAIKIAVGNTGIDIVNNKITAKTSNFEIVNSSGTKTFGIDSSGNLESSGSASFKGKITATSGSIGGFTISSTQIKSDNDKIILNKNGKLTATDVELIGKITATGGNIGGFNIIQGAYLYSYSDGHEDSYSSRRGIVDYMSLSSSYINFRKSNYTSASSFTTQSMVIIGGDSVPAAVGGRIFGPQTIQVNRVAETAVDTNGNFGIHLSVEGAKAFDDLSYIHTGNHAIYIEKGNIMGFRRRIRRVSSSQTLSVLDSNIIAISSGITLTLPSKANTEDGQEYWILPITNCVVKTQGSSVIVTPNDSSVTQKTIANRAWHWVVYDRVNDEWFMDWGGG